MVNVVKRMRALNSLLRIRNGPGAAILPPAPSPQLVHVHLKAPYDSFARKFWWNNLRPLKYHNPALPITVDYAKPSPPMRLTLRFEHEDPEVLRTMTDNINVKVRPRTPKKAIIPEDMSEDEKEILARQQSPNFRQAPASWKSKHGEAAAVEQAATEAEIIPEKVAEDKKPNDIPGSEPIPSDEVVLQPASATSKAKAAPPLYARDVSLLLRNRTGGEIWQWFEAVTQARPVPTSQEDVDATSALEKFFEQSAIDRQRVKEGREAVRKEKADLQRARGEADALKAEA